MPNYPRLHHYVPQFYLSRFVNDKGKLWVWDKTLDRSFAVSPSAIAAESHFYRIPDVPDPLAMEKQFSEIEGNASLITSQWLHSLHDVAPLTKIDVPDINRREISLYLTTQLLRTADQRQILSLLAEDVYPKGLLDATTKPDLHIRMLWDDVIVNKFRRRFCDSVWVFARNNTNVPFVTSDNPIIFKTRDNHMWVKVGMLSGGTYSVFPLSPDIIMYCYDGSYSDYTNLRKFDCTLSPVALTEGMAEQENTGQAFAASRFVISRANDFTTVREFADTIGTDRYAPKS